MARIEHPISSEYALHARNTFTGPLSDYKGFADFDTFRNAPLAELVFPTRIAFNTALVHFAYDAPDSELNKAAARAHKAILEGEIKFGVGDGIRQIALTLGLSKEVVKEYIPDISEPSLLGWQVGGVTQKGAAITTLYLLEALRLPARALVRTGALMSRIRDCASARNDGYEVQRAEATGMHILNLIGRVDSDLLDEDETSAYPHGLDSLPSGVWY